MDPSEVVNGEESEECTHRCRAKLFRLDKKEWVEMGIGNMKVRSGGDRFTRPNQEIVILFRAVGRFVTEL